MIRCYDLRRYSTGQKEEAISICERHLEARKVLGWVVIGEERKTFAPVPSCSDCREAERQPTVLDRIIEADTGDADEPAPVVTLRGQRRLF